MAMPSVFGCPAEFEKSHATVFKAVAVGWDCHDGFWVAVRTRNGSEVAGRV